MQSREEWFEDRRKGIGGSDAAAILGLSKWATQLQIYLDKRGEAPEQDDNEYTTWGRALEPVIREQYAAQTGRSVWIPNSYLENPQYPWMIGNLDGIADNSRVLEIKTARSGSDWGEPGTDEIPVPYMCQVQHYMAITGFPVADVAVLIAGSDFRIYEVPADAEFQAMMIDEEAAFWKRVQEGIPPDPVTLADMQAKFGRFSRVKAVEASIDALDAFDNLLRARENIKIFEGVEARVKTIIMGEMGENDTLVSGGKTLITWKLSKGATRFDEAAFKAAHPELYQQFLKVGKPSRRFLIKEK